MYGIVPLMPSLVFGTAAPPPSRPRARAMPKSSTFTTPSLVTKMLSGLRSQWTIDSSWARTSARTTCTISSMARDGAMVLPPASCLASSSPSRNSSAMYGLFFHSSAS
jgi:hypothetical protein